MEIFIQVVGWIGTVLLILAYILVSSKKVSASSAVYQFLNLFGASGVGINVFHSHAWPALVVNVFWGLVAFIALLNLRFGKNITHWLGKVGLRCSKCGAWARRRKTCFGLPQEEDSGHSTKKWYRVRAYYCSNCCSVSETTKVYDPDYVEGMP